MKDSFEMACLQMDISWENPERNLEKAEGFLERLPMSTDLVFLPETFATGFTMHADQFAATPGDPVHQWLERNAREKGLVLCGSLIVQEGGRIYNRMYWVSPEGITNHYDKRHLFRMGREDELFTPGEERRIFSHKGVHFLPQICYDLRFPVFTRSRNDYEVLIYSANWPAPRHKVWEALLRARAIENQAYVIGVNRCGVDGEGVDHLGGSCLISPRGDLIEQLGKEEGILSAELDILRCREFREHFPVWKDADDFSIRM